MSAIKSFLGYSLAILAIPVTIAIFVGLNGWAALLVNGTGLKLSPWHTGGEALRAIDHGSYVTRIHKPVFDAVLGQYDKGFVQIDWMKKAAVPAQIDEAIDYDDDGKPDFRIKWSTRTGTPELAPLQPGVLGLRAHLLLSDSYTVRVNLHNPAK
jgi:hypothetical protein